MKRRFWGERELYFLLSVAIAFVMWLYVATAQNPLVTRPLRVDLQMHNLPPDEVVLRPSLASPVQVSLRLQGPRAQIAQLDPKTVDAYVDLSGLGPGEHPQVPVTVVVPAADVRVVDQRPTSVLIVLDSFASKRLPVDVSLVGTPPQDVTLGTPRVSPSHVVVSGPARQVGAVRHALVSLDTAALRQQVVTSLPVIPADASGQAVPGVQVTPQIVGVTLPVHEGVISKIVPVVPTLTGAPSIGLTVVSASADPETVALTGPIAVLQPIENAPTGPIDLTNARADFARPAPLQLPAGISASVRQVTVTVHLGRDLLSTVFRAVPVRVVGVPRGAASRVMPDHVDVQVAGPQNVIQRLRPQAVSVQVSAAGRGTGQFMASPQAILPKGVRVLTIQPAQVLVILSPS
jgi:YbbR domain-containing protein